MKTSSLIDSVKRLFLPIKVARRAAGGGGCGVGDLDNMVITPAVVHMGWPLGDTPFYYHPPPHRLPLLQVTNTCH